jgi:hypothetical protein
MSKRKVTLGAGRRRQAPGPVTSTQVPKVVMAAARAAVRGRDVHAVVQRDGTVLIVNGERKLP